MIKNDWFTKYYFILKVMNKNRESENPLHETKVILWGNKVLKQELDFLKKKYPSLSHYFDVAEQPYYDDMRRIHENVLDQIFENIKNNHGNSNEKTNDCD